MFYCGIQINYSVYVVLIFCNLAQLVHKIQKDLSGDRKLIAMLAFEIMPLIRKSRHIVFFVIGFLSLALQMSLRSVLYNVQQK